MGSCADIVATVVKPLLKFGNPRVQPSTYSVFVDSRLLLRRVEGLALPFSEDVVYIFYKQIEEAGLLVLNKADLLPADGRKHLAEWAEGREQGCPWKFQNSLSNESVISWVDALQGGAVVPQGALKINYDRYSRGETQMAWLDETLSLDIPGGEGRQVVMAIIEALLAGLSNEQAAIGHLKFILESGGVSTKLSFTSLEDPNWRGTLPRGLGHEIRVLVNMRAELEAERLRQILQAALHRTAEIFDFRYEESHVDFFHPAPPKPTHRLG